MTVATRGPCRTAGLLSTFTLFVFQAINNRVLCIFRLNRGREVNIVGCFRVILYFSSRYYQQCFLYYVIGDIFPKPSANVSVCRPPHQPRPLIVITVVWCNSLALHLWGSAGIRVYPIILRRIYPGVLLKLILQASVESPVGT